MYKRLIISIFVVSTLISCKADGTSAPANANDSVIAKVNGNPIYQSEFVQALKFEVSKYDTKILDNKNRMDVLKNSLIEELIKNRLLYSLALEKKITATENELANEYTRLKSRYTESTFQKMLELRGINYNTWKEDKKRDVLIDKLIQQEVLAKINITDKDISKYYRQHQKDFTHGDEVHARQILVDDQKLADDLRARAVKGDNFAELAQEFSIAPEGKRGGDLGWFQRGIMPSVFDEACFPLPVGNISPVIKSEFGYHIFKVVERRPAAVVKLSEVKDKIVTKLQQEKSEQEFNSWYEPIRKKAKVDIDEKALGQIKITMENK